MSEIPKGLGKGIENFGDHLGKGVSSRGPVVVLVILLVASFILILIAAGYITSTADNFWKCVLFTIGIVILIYSLLWLPRQRLDPENDMQINLNKVSQSIFTSVSKLYPEDVIVRPEIRDIDVYQRLREDEILRQPEYDLLTTRIIGKQSNTRD